MGAGGFAGRVFVRNGAAARKIFLGTIAAISVTVLLLLMLMMMLLKIVSLGNGNDNLVIFVIMTF